MASGKFVEFSASHHAVVVLLGLGDLGSHSSLATRKDATVEVVLATCHKCSSKLCLLFGPFGPTSLQQRELRKNHNFWDSHQLAGSKMVLNRDCAVQKSEAVKL